jgi:hypothetical protein
VCERVRTHWAETDVEQEVIDVIDVIDLLETLDARKGEFPASVRSLK